jgi:NTP pyrophosphatase (non-canonical NTP hydrolase)
MKTKKYKNYQKESRKTWGYVKTEHPLTYPTLGLANEVGEFAGKIKKIFRDKDGKISKEDKEALKGELGDVLWYFTQICTELGLKLEDVAESNLDKLFSRLKRGKIKGEGDNR